MDDDEQKEETVSLRPFCPTRWTVRVKSLKSVKANYKQILDFCNVVGLEQNDAGIKARGFSTYLHKFDTLLLLNITITTLEQVEELNESIQATNINFRSIIRRVEILKTNLNSLRLNERYKEL